MIQYKHKGNKNMNKKIMAMIKEKEQRKQFLKDFLVFALQEQNKYIAINHKEEIENYNKIIFKTLNDIDNLTLAAQELKRDMK
jgi:uncharacterized protein (UPF0248 family)